MDNYYPTEQNREILLEEFKLMVYELKKTQKSLDNHSSSLDKLMKLLEENEGEVKVKCRHCGKLNE